MPQGKNQRFQNAKKKKNHSKRRRTTASTITQNTTKSPGFYGTSSAREKDNQRIEQLEQQLFGTTSGECKYGRYWAVGQETFQKPVHEIAQPQQGREEDDVIVDPIFLNIFRNIIGCGIESAKGIMGISWNDFVLDAHNITVEHITERSSKISDDIIFVRFCRVINAVLMGFEFKVDTTIQDIQKFTYQTKPISKSGGGEAQQETAELQLGQIRRRLVRYREQWFSRARRMKEVRQEIAKLQPGKIKRKLRQYYRYMVGIHYNTAWTTKDELINLLAVAIVDEHPKLIRVQKQQQCGEVQVESSRSSVQQQQQITAPGTTTATTEADTELNTPDILPPNDHLSSETQAVTKPVELSEPHEQQDTPTTTTDADPDLNMPTTQDLHDDMPDLVPVRDPPDNGFWVLAEGGEGGMGLLYAYVGGSDIICRCYGTYHRDSVLISSPDGNVWINEPSINKGPATHRVLTMVTTPRSCAVKMYGKVDAGTFSMDSTSQRFADCKNGVWAICDREEGTSKLVCANFRFPMGKVMVDCIPRNCTLVPRKDGGILLFVPSEVISETDGGSSLGVGIWHITSFRSECILADADEGALMTNDHEGSGVWMLEPYEEDNNNMSKLTHISEDGTNRSYCIDIQFRSVKGLCNAGKEGGIYVLHRDCDEQENVNCRCCVSYVSLDAGPNVNKIYSGLPLPKDGIIVCCGKGGAWIWSHSIRLTYVDRDSKKWRPRIFNLGAQAQVGIPQLPAVDIICN